MLDVLKLPPPAAWDHEVDVLVLGSGAGGLATATVAAMHGASALVLEKCDTFGGGAATSGGVVWVPANSDLPGKGIEDSLESAAHYLRRVLGNRPRWELVQTYLDNAPKMEAFFNTRTEVKLVARMAGPDYHSEEEGALPAGRMMDPAPFDGRSLGKWFDRLRPPIPTFLLFGGMMVGKYDIDALARGFRSFASARHGAKLVARFAWDKLRRYKRGTRLALGNALAGRLLKSALDAGVELWDSVTVKALVMDGDRVVGLAIERRGKQFTLRARQGLVLATGGFPANTAMMGKNVPYPDQHQSMAPDSNVGDGIAIGIAAGGHLDDINLDNAFWTPVSVMTRPDGSILKCPHLIIDRSKPGVIAVNQQGRRFVNEGASYHDFVAAMHREHAHTPSIPAWLVCDARFLAAYGLGLAKPWPFPHGALLKAGYLVKAPSLAALAHKIGVPADALEAEAAAHTRFAATGVDTDFGKGSTGYNRYLGDPDHQPSPCLGPIGTPPFYAVKIVPGDIGTSLGLRTDEQARVLDAQDQPIPGLYACGNDMNSVMAGTYPSGGITLGPAMTFGYLIGRSLGAAARGERHG
jgi:succinate dehydrogenase/fumarate reductase flavoprotein subunit